MPLSALCLSILPRLASFSSHAVFAGRIPHSLGESWACNGKTSKKAFIFVRDRPTLPILLKHHLFFITPDSRWGGHWAAPWPRWVSMPCYDPMCPQCLIKWEWALLITLSVSTAACAHVLTHTYIASAHLNTVAHISTSYSRLPWLILWVQHASRLHREQIFGSVTTAEQNEKQNETYYNRESVLFHSANNENMFFQMCFSLQNR